MYVCAPRVCLVLGEAKGVGWLGATVSALGIKPESPERAACALNHWATSLAFFLFNSTQYSEKRNDVTMEIITKKDPGF